MSRRQSIVISDHQPTEDIKNVLIDLGYIPNDKISVFDKHEITSSVGKTPYDIGDDELTFFVPKFKKELYRLLAKKSHTLFYILYGADHQRVADSLQGDVIRKGCVDITHVFSIYSDRIFMEYLAEKRNYLIF